MQLPLLDIIFNGSVINNRNSNFIINFLDINKDLIIILLFLIFLHSYLKIFSFLIYTKFSSAFMMHLGMDISRRTFENIFMVIMKN